MIPFAYARFTHALSKMAPDPATPLGLAVSGGPDSLALLLLAHDARPGQIHVATVDHGLRPESAAEAAMVARVCAERGIPHATLRADWAPASGIGLQAQARDHRYRLLDQWCADRKLPFLATAHHADDQAETVLMRLARGSGIAGLSGIRPLLSRTADDGVSRHAYTIIRPLLRVTKHALRDIVDQAGLKPVSDPSNLDPRHDRTRFRAFLEQQSLLTPERLAAVASHMADAEAALAWTAAREYERRVAGTDELITLDVAGLPAELLRRIVASVLSSAERHATAGGSDSRVDGPELTRLIDRVMAGTTSTIGHVQVRGGNPWKFRPLWRSRRR